MANIAAPSKETLRSWLLGHASETEDAAVVAALAAMPELEQQLAELDHATDQLVQSLRQPDPLREAVQEPGCAKLVERVRQMQPTTPTIDSAEAARPPAPAAASPPTLGSIGNYLLIREIKAGGMGALYEAHHPKLKRKVALKMIRPDRTGADVAARFEQEMEALGRLDHPNLVRAFDAGATADGRLYLVLELLEGMDLDDVVRSRGQLPIAEACAVIHQAALGLHYAHEKGAVHRDVKPSNLFLTREGVVKVLDLGLAQLRDLDTDAAPGERLTTTGQTMGTPDYIAPEQIDDAKHVDRRADLYSLGCTFYHLLNGSPPFGDARHNTISKKFIAHAQEPPPSIKDVRADVPAAVVQLLDQLLAKAPDQRAPTAAAVAEVLRPFAEASNLVNLATPGSRDTARAIASSGGISNPAQGIRTMSPTPTPAAAASPKLSKRMWAGIALVALFLAIGAWAMREYKLSGDTSANQPPPKTATAPQVIVPRPDPTLRIIADYLEKQPLERRPHLRFFTMTHLAGPAFADDAAKYQKGLVAWESLLHAKVVTAVDATALVHVVSVVDLGWEAKAWGEFLKLHPYGLVPPETDRIQTDLRRQIRQTIGGSPSYLRTDWFQARVLSKWHFRNGEKEAKREDLPVPLKEAIAVYERPLNLTTAAAELGLANGQQLAAAIRTSDRLRALGLGPLAEGGTVERKLWEKIDDSGISVFQHAASELGLGTPYLGF